MDDVVKRTDRNSRVLMLGIDAMSFPFASTHLDQLPALQSLLRDGVLIAPKTSGSNLAEVLGQLSHTARTSVNTAYISRFSGTPSTSSKGGSEMRLGVNNSSSNRFGMNYLGPAFRALSSMPDAY